jgi:hypothetical protein
MLGIAVVVAGLSLAAATRAQNDGAGEILDEEAVMAAETGKLEAETRLLAGIGSGISLSLAVCDLTDECSPAVAREELQSLLDLTVRRIDVLLARRFEADEASLDSILVAYATARDRYSAQLEQLGTVLPAEPGAAGLDEMTGDVLHRQDPAEAAGPEDLEQLFQDLDLQTLEDFEPEE